MNEALTYLYYIYDKFVDLVFNRLEIANNISIGWIIVSVIIFSILIRSILNLPRGMSSFEKFRPHVYESWGYKDGKFHESITRSRRIR